MNIKTFEEVLDQFRTFTFNENFDMIVAIANGGIIPAAILNQRLNIDIQLLKINLRDSNQQPKYDTPQLMSSIDFEVKNKTILVVDDRVRTGATMDLARNLLRDAKLVKTFAVNGKADYPLYNESCFKFPWIL